MASADLTESSCGEELNLPQSFDLIFRLHRDMENTDDSTASDKSQARIRKGIITTEKAIAMVNELELFSRNEDIEEVSTSEIKYLLLSAYLGYLTNLDVHTPRNDAVKKSMLCYKDFLRLCNAYNMTQVPVDDDSEDESAKAVIVRQVQTRSNDVNAMSVTRNTKIQRFKEKKALETRLRELKEQVDKDHVDDEVRREFYIMQVKHWANLSVDEIENCKLELEMLAHREKLKEMGPSDTASCGSNQSSNKPKPFRPFILTKTELQKQVFGAGYPSIATMTVDEFYEQKLKEGTLTEAGHDHEGHSLQNWAADPEKDALDRETEEAEKESKEEQEDPESLQRARAMDDWKDEHRRGDGNRYNMG